MHTLQETCSSVPPPLPSNPYLNTDKKCLLLQFKLTTSTDISKSFHLLSENDCLEMPLLMLTSINQISFHHTWVSNAQWLFQLVTLNSHFLHRLSRISWKWFVICYSIRSEIKRDVDHMWAILSIRSFFHFTAGCYCSHTSRFIIKVCHRALLFNLQHFPEQTYPSPLPKHVHLRFIQHEQSWCSFGIHHSSLCRPELQCQLKHVELN